jgi:hypothetical protein
MDCTVLADWKTLTVGSYLAIAVLTLGAHHRSARQRSSVALVKSAFWAAIWPIYWLGPIGPFGTLQKLVEFVVHVVVLFSRSVASLRGELLFVYYSVAFLFMPAYQIYLRWDGSDGLWPHLWVVVKAVLWGVVWPLYMVIRIFNL